MSTFQGEAPDFPSTPAHPLPDPTPDRAAHAHARLHQQLTATAHPAHLSAGRRHTDAHTIATAAQSRDVILTMGTGDITDLGPRILRALRAQTLTACRNQPRRRPRSARRKS